ncbi:protease complex subunit PrcB family protein [Eubacterium ventriosum]|nr:protease complex subunit PrcB family protein [Eubacterium ventriosum]
MIIVSSCGIEKISRKKIKDIDFTVVAEIEMPLEVKQIVEKRKEQPFKVTYSDNQYTYIIIGYGRQNHQGYSIKVNNLYETKNGIYIKTEFQGPKEYSNSENVTYPYIVVKIEQTDKSVIFSE